MTPELEEIRATIRGLLNRHFQNSKPPDFVPGESSIPLNVPSWGWQEIDEAVDSLLSTMLTMGRKVATFEQMFARYVGTRQAVMVNSGSSANLLALSALAAPWKKNPPLKPGHEIIMPAVTWSTTAFPAYAVQARPHFVDVDPKTFNIDVAEVQKAIGRKTKAVFAVHLLGHPAEVAQLREICDERGLFLIEDSCEAHGASLGTRKVGSFGDLSTFSFFFSHHVSTVEGGTVHCQNQDLANDLRSLRAHGWVRERTDKADISATHADIDPRFLFAALGYNLRPTEIQGAFGIHQLPKLEGFIGIRRENARALTDAIRGMSDLLQVQEELPGQRHVWFGYPILVRKDAPFSRFDLTSWLEKHKIETRPIMGGNLTEQPAFQELPYGQTGALPVARHVHRRGFFVGNHQGIRAPQRDYLIRVIEDFFRVKPWDN